MSMGMKTQIVTFTAALALATTVLAHSGVKDPGVMARMETMSAVGRATGVLGDMAKGKKAFDAAEAEAARIALIAGFQEVPQLFEEPHQDPKSEALPAIWEQYDDFLAKNDDAIVAAKAMDLQTLDSLRASMGGLGASCGACHKLYRK